MIRYSIIIPHRGPAEELARLMSTIPQREDVQVVVVHDTEGHGGGWARNEGLRQAQGQWLLFADADDFYADGFLDVLDGYASRADIDVVYFGFQMVSAATLETEYIEQATYISRYDGSAEATSRVRFKINSPWCKMLRRSLVTAYDLHFEATAIGNDLFFSLMVGHYAQNIAVEKAVLYNYVHYAASQTNRQWNRRKLRDYIAINLRANSFFRATGHRSLCRRLPNLWLEALRTGGLGRMLALTRTAIAERSYLRRTADDYIRFIATHDGGQISDKA